MPNRCRPRPWPDLFAIARAPLAGQQGSLLIATVIAVSIVATLGTAIYSLVSTASLTQIGSMSDTKAYYLAESGGHYAIKQLLANVPPSTAACNTLLNGTYSVTNAGQFTLQSCTYTAATGKYRFVAKGSPSDGSASREINYIVMVPNAAGVEIPFTGTGDTLDPHEWNVTGVADLDSGDEKVELNDNGEDDTQISLDWSNADSTMPDLGQVWEDANGLLTYEVQVKVRLANGLDIFDHDVMAGISFRLNTQGDTDITNDSFYGVSFLWCQDHGDLPAFCGSAFTESYIVLWRQAADGSKTLIGKQLASSVSSSLVSGLLSNKLVDWATMVIRVQEQINPTTGVRENLIYVFAGVPATSPKGTIHWDYSNYTAVSWEESFAGTDCSGGDLSCAADSTLTTANFNTTPQDEIGLHAFGDEQGEVADLALRFNFNGGVATSY